MKKITAADLLRLDFKQVDVPAEESGDKDYFYFVFNLESNRGYSLLITDDDNDENDEYTVEFTELDDIIVIRDLDDLESLVGIIKRNITK